MVCHMTTTEPLKTTAEAAAFLGKSIRTVVRMAREGEITPAVKGPGIRGAYFFTTAECQRVKDARQGSTPAGAA